MNSKFDVAVIGAGVAGAFATLRIAKQHKNTKTLLIELGKPCGKRRRFLESWFGCFPTGDGKLYKYDIDNVLDLVDGRRAKAINKWIMDYFNDVNKTKIIQPKNPSADIIKKSKELNFDLKLHPYMQWYPESIHRLSRLVADELDIAKNIEMSFDNEVFNIHKKGNEFIITTTEGEFRSKKVILCAGRTGWRWVTKLFKDLGILISDDYARFGIKIEIPAQYMKDFNKSHCSFIRSDLEIGPFQFNGSIIQEDHAQMTVANFRSNEDRWKSDKVFFSIISNREYKNEGTVQTDRIAQLTHLLCGDRVGREKVKSLIKGDSQLSFLPEYSWIVNTINEVEKLVPSLVARGYFHSPDINTLTSRIRIGNNLETEVSGLFVAGESAGIKGILAAAITGAVAAESVCKD